MESWLTELEEGVARAIQIGSFGFGDNGKTGLTPTYFSYNVTSWIESTKRNKDGHPLIIAKGMSYNLFPLFLEGPMRMLKTVNASAAEVIYNKLKVSPLRDDELGMYTISASLEGQTYDMGREMSFAAGWLENQSVWLHMSYKYYLGLLRQGLFEQFFQEMTSGGMLPFMDPQVYGRSLMECSSFIASSAFEDPSVRGQGYLARLSGSTAEFLSMWALMVLGPRPFFWHQESYQIRMQLIPAIPRWMFDESDPSDAKLFFKLFGSINVTYHHKRGNENLYRIPPSRYVVVLRDGTTYNITEPSIPFDIADRIRRVVFVASIDVYFEKK
jgi:hypothetical protein